MKATALLTLAVLIAAPQQAAACKCARDLNALPEGSEAAVAADLEGSDVVFSGKVIGLQSRARLFLRIPRYWFMTRGDRELSDEEEYRILRRRVRLKVEEAFKGVPGDKVVLYTGWGGGDCGYGFRRGSRYLVYGRDSYGDLYTGICLATKAMEDAAGEIEILRRLSKRRVRPENLSSPKGAPAWSLGRKPQVEKSKTQSSPEGAAAGLV
jgi:hypothetical protein